MMMMIKIRNKNIKKEKYYRNECVCTYLERSITIEIMNRIYFDKCINRKRNVIFFLSSEFIFFSLTLKTFLINIF